MPTQYIGRFAPSPTGPLHMGSLLAALASFLEAKSQQGQWLLRIEDLDPPREQVGAIDDIIRALEAHGLEHDGDICFQSQRSERYIEVLEQLLDQKKLFPCRCSRQMLSANGGIHNGRCEHAHIPLNSPNWAWRISYEDRQIQFSDTLQGEQQQSLKKDVGDFVLLRKDGLFAYQLAVVVDDIDFGVTHIVRGSDLMDSTARQIFLYQSLGQAPVEYCHLPLIMNDQGQKLSKQNHAPALELNRASENLHDCLQMLGQEPPSDLRYANCKTLLAWAEQHWDIHKVPQSLPRGAGAP
ncbi:tRNA glutamyl-Q(34) synthetase GluQRS [Pseudoteredinibacter isoporae]|uniref:Glutamyl-Q tRNA(Asp) synthetase n=1 Tax=Pseudoteredinibacter isoporae TaxID=570281 RepID=A0A7X0MX09_9GAMM|nr:tRNA glutamyl-Q(34) synthetase GluQRS [Pseudoteredinibacter isoporae]MBB6522978.1 glutamyl-Q tRNA(Asp) synthetase [Pseudoteredinibacter isoporae]NHO88502.1 tRNA glutamyl-Q(34) synthetase GluQRS [Pseudoteredinibacter isoporae]NIB22099.1 tRNA glutamyl-Q(34) synthetase GluQRS [Pseudoteredinibacter isoporae]